MQAQPKAEEIKIGSSFLESNTPNLEEAEEQQAFPMQTRQPIHSSADKWNYAPALQESSDEELYHEDYT